MSNGIGGKLLTLLRGGANNVGEAIVDKNAITILQQEIRDAKDALTTARNSLVKQMGERKVIAGKKEKQQAQLAEYNGYMPKLIAQNNDALARETAGKIAALENEIAEYDKTLTGMDANITNLENSIRTGDATVASLERRIDSVKATEQVQRAQQAVDSAATGTNAKVRSAMDSLDRIQARQEQSAAELQAAHEVAAQQGDGGLQQRLQDAGVIPGASAVEDVMARFKNPQQ